MSGTMRTLLALAAAGFMAGPRGTSAAQAPPPAAKQAPAAATAKPQTAKPGSVKPGTAKPGTAKPATKKPAPPAAAKSAMPSREAITTPSGLTYVITSRANGRRPKPGETVLVHYTGTLTDGTKFDSSQDRKEPIAFPLGRGAVIKGWDEGIAQLGVGDRAVLVIPPQLGYGASGAGGVIPPDATLVFVVTLVDIKGEALSEVLLKIIDERGIDAAVSEYRRLQTQGFGNFYTNEGDTNTLGYRLLRRKKTSEAIEVLKLNVEAYPASANAYDSLGEAYLSNGDTEHAIQNYEKSLSLDPANANAAAVLKKLKGQ